MPKTTTPFSILSRKAHLEQLENETFHMAIIGGGITGAGIALDAASRGLKVCLIEKNDFASGTSSKSTKLIHGGLRYLKQFEIGLVRESGSERAIIHNLAPHLVTPEKMLLPLIKGGTYGKLMTSIGLKVYDFLAGVKGNDKRRMLNKEETFKKEPLLNNNLLLGGGYYAEYRTDDARLTLEILKKAASLGAVIVNYCNMQAFEYDSHSKIKNLICKDLNTGHILKIKAHSYVSATGPWVDTIRNLDQSLSSNYLQLTKGVHVVFPFEKLPIKQALYFDAPDGRMVFAIPRGRTTYVGTTDTNYHRSLDRVIVTKNDAEYLLQAINRTFPSVQLNIEDIESHWAGLRPLIHEDNKAPAELSRKDELFISDSGLISIAGGKLTGYRRMAQRVIETVLKTLNKACKEHLKKSSTDKIPLVTPRLENTTEVKRYQKELEEILQSKGVTNSFYPLYLCTTYGKQANVIIKKSNEFNSTCSRENLIRAELWYSIHYEMTNSLADFFVRRTGMLYFDIYNMKKHLKIALNDCINYLEWDAKRIASEKEQIKILQEDATRFYNEEF
ncbi:glycerol-3-phosphate dehydrogenase/oxidase [Cognatitamlana onchidii]|uniref:glycerol-3-phosphate dehydrogenase/oxidase n=1 Tax=Cognatitamlana onchidii TaxID=2562860 RepID=UPI0010A61C8A|nr:glycerol-3-phosphate dehydrogenase/oxidase [Algibacter onchidii]